MRPPAQTQRHRSAEENAEAGERPTAHEKRFAILSFVAQSKNEDSFRYQNPQKINKKQEGEGRERARRLWAI